VLRLHNLDLDFLRGSATVERGGVSAFDVMTSRFVCAAEMMSAVAAETAGPPATFHTVRRFMMQALQHRGVPT
jgi:hypothetical protein